MNKGKTILTIVLIIGGIGLLTGYRYLKGKDFWESEKMRGVLYEQEYERAKEGVGEVEYEVEEVVRGLNVPWSIVFTDEERMLITERTGAIRVVEKGMLQEKPLMVFEETATGDEEGLMGLTKHPMYVVNRYLYASLAYEDEGGMWVKVERLIDEGEEIKRDRVIIDRIPAAKYHAGSRIKFGPDNKLYVTTGDATNRELAQDKNSLAGKILRMNDDGSIPSDNPIKDSLIYSLGHRNPQGIDWQPVTNRLFSTEHGPSGFDGAGGGDELNLIKPGANYGWPVVSHERNNPSMESPLMVWTPAVAPASGMFYTGDNLPQFKGDFFFGGLRGEGIFRVVMGEGGEKVVEWEKLAEFIGSSQGFGRIREVTQGPEGAIYFSSSNKDGRGRIQEGDDKIYRLIAK